MSQVACGLFCNLPQTLVAKCSLRLLGWNTSAAHDVVIVHDTVLSANPQRQKWSDGGIACHNVVGIGQQCAWLWHCLFPNNSQCWFLWTVTTVFPFYCLVWRIWKTQNSCVPVTEYLCNTVRLMMQRLKRSWSKSMQQNHRVSPFNSTHSSSLLKSGTYITHNAAWLSWHHWGIFFRFHTASSGATKGFIIVFSHMQLYSTHVYRLCIFKRRETVKSLLLI